MMIFLFLSTLIYSARRCSGRLQFQQLYSMVMGFIFYFEIFVCCCTLLLFNIWMHLRLFSSTHLFILIVSLVICYCPQLYILSRGT
ncbi:hypothetical protein T10_263 [Trichinella papuae]|uniref:Uncharacterized protein n=1 Tax=Trichinella papuae TaxID=268474 RepID=A0A0V1M4P6_9BILA|nr:hypothetical protein T10_263 [Trichinella papuae]KRZ66657.1 hypothetical protein T10_263 [Trichinella papuae]KRZ66658.1 hypothetical protein T10_263 [Trichinella papuae]